MQFYSRTTVGIHILILLSGATGLICEVVWTRWLTGVLGSASAATAIVLAIFMGGLGAGSWLSARLADLVRRPVRLYAFAELGVAALVLLPFWETRWIAPLFATVDSRWGPNSLTLDCVRVAVAILAIGPPTMLMGASLPLVVKAMVNCGGAIGRGTATAYAANSLGGVVGTLLAGFLLIESFGLQGTALIAVVLAVTVGLWGLWLDRLTSCGMNSAVAKVGNCRGTQGGGKASDTHTNGHRKSYRLETPKTTTKVVGTGTLTVPQTGAFWLLVAAALSGFCAMGYETIWSRILSTLTLNTTYAFSLMLAVLLCGLSLGSWLIRGRLDRARDPVAWFVTLQILLALYAVSSLLWSPAIVDMANQLVPSGEAAFFAPWFSRPLVMAAGLLLIPSMLMGASLPIACKMYATATGGIGRPVGRVYSANTFGSVAGAVAVGLFLIPSLGTWWATVVCAVLGAVTAVGLSCFFTAADRRVVYTAGASAAAIVVAAVGLLHADAFVNREGLGPHDEVVFRSEDEYGLVEVVEDQRLGTRWMLTNRLHWEGSTLPRAVAEQRKQGLLPLLLHGSPRRVLEIGVGTGIKLSALDVPAVEEAVAVEISPGVIEASRLFADYNHGVTSNHSKVEIVCADGRNYVALTPRKFDVIVNGLLTPYRAGVSRLYTVEHFYNCRAKLADDGMFVVWVAIRQIAPDDLRVLTRTLLEVFPHTTMWLDGYYAAFVSTNRPTIFNLDKIEQLCSDVAFARALDEAGIDSPVALLAMFVAGPDTLSAFAVDQPLNTEDRPIIEFRTPRLGDRLNTSDLAAEMVGTLSLLQEPLFPKYLTASDTAKVRLLRAQQARWMARQALIQKCYRNHVAAATIFREALTLDRSDDLARYELEIYLVAHGKQCVARGLYDKAHQIYRQAVGVNPRSIGALASLAALEERVGNRAEAERLRQQALSLDPRNWHLRHHLGSLSSSKSAERY